MKTFDKKEDTNLNAADFLGIYLGKDDFEQETVLTIVDVSAEQIPRADRKKLVVRFAECEKRLILNSTNIKLLTKIFGSTDTAKWRGPISVYVDQQVEFAGRSVGGIRVKPASRNGAARGHETESSELANRFGLI